MTSQGFNVATAESGWEAIELTDEQHPDLVVMDPLLPDMSRGEIMTHLRERYQVPVIFISARATQGDKINGLDLGADDYVTKPIDTDELGARVRAVLRRYHTASADSYCCQVGRLAIDFGRQLALVNGRPIRLTRTERKLLLVLASHCSRAMAHDELLGRVWGPGYLDDPQYLKVWICRLRAKLKAAVGEEMIQTVNGMGYMLECTPGGGESRSVGPQAA